MISRDDCIEYVLNQIPEFQNSWENHLDYWDGEEPGLCNDLASFCRFTVAKIISGDQELLARIFSVAENMLSTGDDEVSTAVATCFLESLINTASAGTISSLSFVNFMGEESKAHCRMWDEFTGSETLGL